MVEFFDECQTENIVSALRLRPEKVYFVGYKNRMTRRKTDALKAFFATTLPSVVLEFVETDKFDFDAVCDTLADIVDKNDDCCFDITGGEEPILAAMGAVSTMRDVSVIQTSVHRGEVHPLKGHCDFCPAEFPKISVENMVRLFGGSVLHGELGETEWQFTDGFMHDIDLMWSVCRKNPAKWNRETMIFKTISKYGSIDDRLHVRIWTSEFDRMYPGFEIKESILPMLAKAGLICRFEHQGGVLSFSYKNSGVYSAMLKAGNLLELYAYRTAAEICRNEPGFYADTDIGIYLDWDGVVHEKPTPVRDTKNEIDLLFIRGVRPVFVSCKNGEVKKEDLYELETVANKLGGKYAEKVILTNYICADPVAADYIVQRAHDMHITLIRDIDKMTFEEFKRELRRATV